MSFKFGFITDETNNGESHKHCEESKDGQDSLVGDVFSHVSSLGCSTIIKNDLNFLDVTRCIQLLAECGLKYDTVDIPSVEPLRKVLISPSSGYPCCCSDPYPLADNRPVDTAKSSIRSKNTDIIGGVYEGGLKVWECSIDLCNYLAEVVCCYRDEQMKKEIVRTCTTNRLRWNDCRIALSGNGSILELGCGNGLPGCLIYREALEERKRRGQKGCFIPEPNILFTDYNDFVLKDATLPNIFLNVVEVNKAEGLVKISNVEQLSNIGVVSGDWMELSSALKRVVEPGAPSKQPLASRFDLILAAETTYTLESTRQTAIFLARHLRVTTGVGLIATKRYYFGVGGGADAFRDVTKEAIVENESYWDSYNATQKRKLFVETLREYDNGGGNIREILRVRLLSNE